MQGSDMVEATRKKVNYLISLAQNTKRADIAFDCLQEAMSNDSSYCQSTSFVWYKLGNHYASALVSPDWKLASLCYENAVKFDEANYAARNNLGICYFYLANPEAAFECYSKAAQIKPDYAKALFNISVCFEKGIGTEIDIPIAIAGYTKVLSLKADYEQALKNLKMLKLTKQEGGALDTNKLDYSPVFLSAFTKAKSDIDMVPADLGEFKDNQLSKNQRNSASY